jgi:hypothetical protein
MSDNNNLISNNDNSEQELSQVFINIEDINEGEEKVDYSDLYILPTIKTRYFSTVIDVIIILLLGIGISALIEEIGQVPDYIRGILFIVIVFLYEPVLVSFGSTIGQLLLNIRVRSFKNPEKRLAFPFAVFRFGIKLFLGWLSFITVTFNVNKRAIHDFASGSIMIANKIEN